MASTEQCVFVTLCDERYLPRAVALQVSLTRYAPDAVLYIACMTEQCEKEVENLHIPNVYGFSKTSIEEAYPALKEAKKNRSASEYLFTITPAVVKYMLDHTPVELVTYVDSDMYFFSDPTPVIESLKGASVGITPHRYTKKTKRLEEKAGIYNVGWVSFRSDENGIACCNWWLESCIEWCYDRYEGEKFADQKYLNQFSKRFKGVVDINHVGVNAAPWNVEQYTVSVKNGQVFLDDQPLVLYHFSTLAHFHNDLYLAGTALSGIVLEGPLRENVYQVYLAVLTAHGRTLPRSLRLPKGLALFSGVGLRFMRRIALAYLRKGILSTKDSAK